MSDVVLAALIGAAASIIVNLFTLAGQSKKRAVDEATREAHLEDRLKSIEKKLDTHNEYAEKLTSLTTDVAVIKNEIKNLNRAI